MTITSGVSRTMSAGMWPKGPRQVHLEPPAGHAEGGSAGELMFADLEDHWSAVPAWVIWFLRFGYFWPVEQGRRRICVISTPCDSPAAGLVALGLMRRRLEVPDAGDLAVHLNRLRTLYQTARESTILRRVNNRRKFCFGHADADGTLWAHIQGSTGQRFKIIEEFAFDWHVDGEPPVQVTRGAPMAPAAILHSLFDGAGPVLEENLARTDSAICLAGRVVGESQTQQALSAVRFRQDGINLSLGSLLTIHGWHEGRVSRVAFFNARTREVDRASRPPLVVCADGAASSARVLAEPRFSRSDIIAVIPRTSDVDQLEAVSQQFASLLRWYTPEDDAAPSPGGVPGGVTVATLRQD